MLQLLSDDPGPGSSHDSGYVAIVIKFGNRQILIENALHSLMTRPRVSKAKIVNQWNCYHIV